MNTGASDQQIRDIQDRLSNLGKEQRELTALLENLQRQNQTHSEPSQNHPVTIDPVTPDRIKLFLGLFLGRPDVFPKRWDNAKTGRSGYSPPAGKVSKQNGLILMAHKAKSIIGLISGWIGRDDDPLLQEKYSDHAYVSDIFVSETHRGQGVAHELLKTLEEEMVKRGCNRIRVC